MGTVETKFTGDIKQLEREYDKLYRLAVRQRQALADVGKESKKSHDEILGHFQHQGTAIKGMALGYLSIHTGIEAISAATEAWRARLEEVHRKTKELNSDLIKQVTLAGDAANIGRIESALSSIPGVKKAEALAAYSGVSSGAPLEGIDRRLALAAAAAPASDLGLDVASFGSFVGELGTLNPKRGAAATADLALAMQQRLGSRFEKFTGAKQFGAMRGLVASGTMTETQALAFGAQAAAQDMPGLPAALMAALDRTYEAPQTKGRTTLTADERAKLTLAQAGSAREKYAAILANRDVANIALGGGAEQLGRIDQASMAGILAAIEGSGGTMAAMKRGVLTSRAGRQQMAVSEQEVRAAATAKRMGLEVRAEELDAARRILQERMNEEGLGGIAQWVNQKYFEKNVEWSEFFGTSGYQGIGGGYMTDITGSLYRLDPESAKRFSRERNEVEGYQKYNDFGQLIEAMHGVQRAVEQGNAERRADRRGGGVRDINDK